MKDLIEVDVAGLAPAKAKERIVQEEAKLLAVAYQVAKQQKGAVYSGRCSHCKSLTVTTNPELTWAICQVCYRPVEMHREGSWN